MMIYVVITSSSEVEFTVQADAIAYATTISGASVITEQERAERILAKQKREYGLYVSNECIELLGARNKVLGLTGAQVTAMLSALMPVRALLETGALGTARGYLQQFKAGYPSHADIFEDGINDINAFEAEWGL
jgi:hypothetical protein